MTRARIALRYRTGRKDDLLIEVLAVSCFKWAARCLSRPQECVRPCFRVFSAPRAKARSLSLRPHPAVRAHRSALAPQALEPNKLRVLVRRLRCTKDVTLRGTLSLRLLLNSQEFARCIEMQVIREVFTDGR